MADRIILHSDLNCFYASVEVNENPKLRDQAIAVCGSTEERHGIVLTASYPAKRRGVKTGMANWQAVRACPGLICVPPHYDLYVKYSRLVRNIYLRYTDKMEPYGMDECWLDVSGSRQLHGDGTAIAEEIRKAVRDTALMDAVADDDDGKEQPETEKPEVQTPATKQVRIVCASGSVNIRVGNDTKYSRITSVKDGATFEWIATAENGWHAIVVNAQVGWVSGKYSQVV